MNRRDFGKSIAAIAAVPLVPIPTPAAAIVVKRIDVLWGEAIARAQGGVTPAQLSNALKVPLDVAQRSKAN
ncbi:MAG: hypothetical protein AAF386_08590 [Pseudomonadota bacterium]